MDLSGISRVNSSSQLRFGGENRRKKWKNLTPEQKAKEQLISSMIREDNWIESLYAIEQRGRDRFDWERENPRPSDYGDEPE